MLLVGVSVACSLGGGDCDDTNKSVHPGAAEVCDDTDNDCSGKADEGCNDDGDAYCDSKMTVSGKPAICTAGGGDCDDADKAVNPAAAEICDGKDNNCASGIDEGCDDDNDDWCDKNMTVVGSPLVCPKGSNDCDDGNPFKSPGEPEKPCGGVDEDCDGQTDETKVAFLENFDDGKADGWTITSSNTSVTWQVNGSKYVSAAKSLYWGNPATMSYDNGTTKSTAATPAISLPAGGIELVVQYWSGIDPEEYCGAEKFDTFRIFAGTSQIEEICASSTSGWQKKTYNLSAWGGQALSLSFVFDTVDDLANAGTGVFVDDVEVHAVCP
jgi:hypothetical protein